MPMLGYGPIVPGRLPSAFLRPQRNTIRSSRSPGASSSICLKSEVFPAPGPAMTSFFLLDEARTLSTASRSSSCSAAYSAFSATSPPRLLAFVLEVSASAARHAEFAVRHQLLDAAVRWVAPIPTSLTGWSRTRACPASKRDCAPVGSVGCRATPRWPDQSEPPTACCFP